MGRYPFKAVIFDLDGVVTKTALAHSKAWKMTFDEYLRFREKRDREPFREFSESDYLSYVDGKPRYEGVKSFLESRKISIPFGAPSDLPDKETVCGIGNKKNAMFREALKREGPEIYPSTIGFIKDLKKAGVRVGVASSSKNCKSVLESAGIESLFETRVNGAVSAELGLRGKPEGDIFIRAALNLGALPADSVVVEDAASGVEAGRNGGFGLVLGVARKNNRDELLRNGADIVIGDMAEIDIESIEEWFHRKPKPLFQFWDDIKKDSLAFFLDYDGTLTPIVDRPEFAVISEGMKRAVEKVSRKCTVAIVSGRMREDVEKLMGIEGIFYAGSHGFDVVGPGFSMTEPRLRETMPLIPRAIERLKKELCHIPGLLIEEKKFSAAVHYRLVEDERYIPEIKKSVDSTIKDCRGLSVMSGKKVFEIMPDIDWDKGKAIRWIMDALKLSWDKNSIVYIGDDVTDEYAFRTIRGRGTAILVSEKPRESAADFWVSSPAEVKKIFEKVIASR